MVLLFSPVVIADLVLVFQEEYRALRPRAPMPPMTVRFRRFTSLNTTIRLREGNIHVSLSDLLEGALPYQPGRQETPVRHLRR